VKILAIDTSTRFLNVAVRDDSGILALFKSRDEFNHFSLLVPTIEKALNKCSLKIKDINAIALSIGPGSFTGLRVGVSTCKGINFVLGTPIVAVPTLDAIAYNFIGEKEHVLCPLIDAKKQKVYACFYRQTHPPNHLTNRVGLQAVKTVNKPTRLVRRLSDYMLTDIEGVLKMVDRPTLVFGDGATLYKDDCRGNALIRISQKEWSARPEIIAELGFKKAIKKEFTDPGSLVPMYLHSKYCQVKKI